MTKCPTCLQEVPLDKAKIEMDPTDGLPIALSVKEGLGPPVIDPQAATHLKIFLDGVRVNTCVAFDRSEGVVWRHQVDAAGNFMQRDGELIIERMTGKVEVTKPE